MVKSRHSYLEKKEQLFVCICDSLREKMESTFDILKNSKKVGEFQSLPEFALVKTTFQEEPTLLKDFNLSVIFDVFEVTEKELEDLNKHYGYISIHNVNNLNNREKIITPFGEAYVFINNRKIDRVTLIESGDWVDYYSYQTILDNQMISIKDKIKN